MKGLNRWACALLCVAMPLGAAQAQGAGGDAFDEFDESSVIGQGAESVEGASGLGDPLAPPAAPVPEAEPEGEPWRGPSVEFAAKRLRGKSVHTKTVQSNEQQSHLVFITTSNLKFRAFNQSGS